MTEKSHREIHLERMEKLRLKRGQLLSLPPHDALNALVEAPQAVPLVHSFPEEDLFLLMHDIGPDDFLPILAMATNRQWEYLLDMEVWQKDRIDPGAMTEWLGRLLKADPNRLWRLMLDEKIEFIEYYLFRNIEVRVREHDEDPSVLGKGFHTYDDTFYFRIMDAPFLDETERGHREEVITGLINHLAAMDMGVFQKVLLECGSLIPAETEEFLFGRRNIRLAEKGFLPFDEAVGIYTPLTPEAFAELRPKDLDAGEGEAAILPVPLLYDGGGEQTRFTRALSGISGETAVMRLQVEFAALCNRIISADAAVIREKEALSGIVKKAGGYITLGLETLNGDGEPAEDTRLVGRYPLAALFRVGYARALALKSRAGKWVSRSWFKSRKLPLGFWGEELMGVVGGLLIKKPLYFDNYAGGVLYREFESTRDLEVTAARLDEARGFDALFSFIDPVPALPEEGFITHKSLILTLFARSSLGLEGGFAPIPMEPFRSFFHGLWSEDKKGKILLSAKSDFLDWLSGATGLTPLEISEKIGSGLEALFNEMEEEYGNVSSHALDPRFITLFHIKGEDAP